MMAFERTAPLGGEPTALDWEVKRRVQPLRELASSVGQTIHVTVNPAKGGDGGFSAFTPDHQVACILAERGLDGFEGVRVG